MIKNYSYKTPKNVLILVIGCSSVLRQPELSGGSYSSLIFFGFRGDLGNTAIGICTAFMRLSCSFASNLHNVIGVISSRKKYLDITKNIKSSKNMKHAISNNSK